MRKEGLDRDFVLRARDITNAVIRVVTSRPVYENGTEGLRYWMFEGGEKKAGASGLAAVLPMHALVGEACNLRLFSVLENVDNLCEACDADLAKSI